MANEEKDFTEEVGKEGDMPINTPTGVNDASNVSVGKGKVTGYVFVAPKGTTLPNDPTTALATDFTCLGYVSEDGVSQEISTDVTEHKDWNGDTILTTQDTRDETFTFTLVETNLQVLKQVYGDANVTEDSTTHVITVKSNNAEHIEYVYVFEVVLSGGRAKRIVIPQGKIKEVGEIIHRAGELLSYPITLGTTPDTAGQTHYEYIKTA